MIKQNNIVVKQYVDELRNAHIAFCKLELIKSKDLIYLCDPILLKSLIEIVKEQVKEVESVHQGKYYAEDFCTFIDKLYNSKYNK